MIITALRLFRFYRASGMPVRCAASRAGATVWRDWRRTPFHWHTRP